MGDMNIETNNKCLVPSPIAHQGCFHGFAWDISDRDVLVGLVTEILIAHHEHVLRVLHGAAEESPPNKETVIRSVLEHVLAPVHTEQDRYHRDGLLFQHISWIAAASQCTGNDLLSAPHTRKSDKGQDILIVHKHDNGCFITIGEDKATINERDTIRDKVFPEFREYETGSRDNELESATLAILQRNLDSVQSEEVINSILWEKARRYRIVITVCSDAPNDIAPLSLFTGYQDIISGDDKRRRAETVAIPGLRTWFDSFVLDITSRLQEMLGEFDV